MKEIIGSVVLSIGTILVSSMFAVLKSMENIDPIVRASWRLQTTFLSLIAPSSLLLYLDIVNVRNRKRKGVGKITSRFFLPISTVWSGCGYALYNVGLCIALAKTSLLRASLLSQCAPLFIVLFNIFQSHNYRNNENEAQNGIRVHWKHILGVTLTLVGTGIYISSTTTEATITKDSPRSSFLIGDLAASVASVGYAIYISCGRTSRRTVPVYIHLPLCVFVAMLLVCTFALATMDIPENLIKDFEGMKGNYFGSFTGGQQQLISSDGTAGEDFCSNLFGWTCAKYLPRSAFLGIVCGAIAVGMINWSLSYVSTLQAAAANSAEPIAASLIGIIFFSEPVPNIMAILAAMIIVVAMMLCSTDGNPGSEKNVSPTGNNLESRNSEVGPLIKDQL